MTGTEVTDQRPNEFDWRLAVPSTDGRFERFSRAADRLRWYAWALRYPALRRMPPMRLGAGAKLALGGADALTVGQGVTAWPDLTISSYGSVRIGDNVFLGRGVNIACYRSVEIGANTRLAERVSIHDSDHVMEPVSDVEGRWRDSLAAPVKIGSRVWLAANVVVLRGVTIGDDSVVGANSVVTQDVPAGVIAAGVPARTIRELRP